jgi:ubiquinone/menaquinone biosynthesis C-methylase UbiE
MSSERLLLEQKSPWWAEHVHRYHEVLKHIKGNETVLDIACGTGFGSEILAAKCNKVIGGDIDAETIETNNKQYSIANLSFELLDGTKLPYADEYFDIVVSFETIEHTTAYLKMLEEFKRVTKKDGLLFISTPNFYLNSPNGVLVNKFHTQEFTPKEYDAILKKYFSDYKLLGQNYIRYNNQTSFKYSLAKMFEKIFYARGFRKIPIAIQDKIMQLIINKNQYPAVDDYEWTSDINVIEKKCVTQMALVINK